VSRRARTQAGQALLEWLLVATLALLVVIWGSSKWVERAEQVAIEGMGQWLLTLSQAMQTALDTRPEVGPIPGLLVQQPPATSAQWQQALKQAGFLLLAFPENAPLPFQIQVERVPTGPCHESSCPQAWLLLALPPKQWDAKRRAAAAPDLMVALAGKGLVVSALNPSRLQGATLAIETKWPEGTVGVLAWRSDVLPPFVRLFETRPVHLAGGLEVSGRVTVSEGLLLGARASVSGPCAPNGLLMRAPDDELLMCRSGQWQSWQPRRDVWQACLPQSPEHPFFTIFPREILGLPLLPAPPEPGCRCTSGYIPRWVGMNTPSVAGIGVTDGFLCEKS
jgi:hypothetical protein